LTSSDRFLIFAAEFEKATDWKMEKKRLLITGCGRSGTLYASRVCQNLGLDIEHERTVSPNSEIGNDGIASWFMAVDDPEPPYGPSAVDYKFENTLHLVRNPLRVIASFAQSILRKGIYSPDYIQMNVPEIGPANGDETLDPKQRILLQSARYWYYWNLLSEKKADQTVQVEKFEKALPSLCPALGVPFNPDFSKNVSKHTNHRGLYVNEDPWQVAWEDIEKLDPHLHEKIQEMAERYGY
jgi:hypothetical protein